MNYYGLKLYNRMVFFSSNLSKKDFSENLSRNLDYLWKDRQFKLLKNDQFKHPEKYPDLTESKRPVKELKLYNEWFKFEGQDLMLMDFYCLEKNESKYYEVLTVSFAEDRDIKD